MTVYGPHEPAFRASLERLCALRWLRPDADLDALGPAALAWLDARADELVAALQVVAAGDAPMPPLTVRVERSARDACARWAEAWGHPARHPVVAALAAAAQETERELDRRLDVGWRRGLVEELRARLAVLGAAPSPWADALRRLAEKGRAEGRPDPPEWPGNEPAAALTAAQHLLWVLAFGDDALTPSPWAPLVAMFERGAWPAVHLDGTLLVYVPFVRDGALVNDAPGPDARIPLPVREQDGSLLPAAFRALELAGVAAPPSLLRHPPEWGYARGEVQRVGPEPPPGWWLEGQRPRRRR